MKIRSNALKKKSNKKPVQTSYLLIEISFIKFSSFIKILNASIFRWSKVLCIKPPSKIVGFIVHALMFFLV